MGAIGRANALFPLRPYSLFFCFVFPQYYSRSVIMRIVSRPRRHPGLARNRLLHRLDLFVAILASAFRDDATQKKGGGCSLSALA